MFIMKKKQLWRWSHDALMMRGVEEEEFGLNHRGSDIDVVNQILNYLNKSVRITK
jgi:hypothetical protein